MMTAAESRTWRNAMAAWPTVPVDLDYADDEVWGHENVRPSEYGAALVRMREQRQQRACASRALHRYMPTGKRDASGVRFSASRCSGTLRS